MHASDPQHANRLLFLFGRMARRAQQCCGQASVYGVPAAPHAAGQHHQHRLGAVLGQRIDRLESAWCVCNICSLCCFEAGISSVSVMCFLVVLWSCGLVTDTVQAPLEYMNAYSRLVFYSNGARLAVKKIRTSPQQQYGLLSPLRWRGCRLPAKVARLLLQLKIVIRYGGSKEPPGPAQQPQRQRLLHASGDWRDVLSVSSRYGATGAQLGSSLKLLVAGGGRPGAAQCRQAASMRPCRQAPWQTPAQPAGEETRKGGAGDKG